jgi:outer membrane receptor protein involved in Fe transport
MGLRKSLVWLLAGALVVTATEGHAQATPPAAKPTAPARPAPGKPAPGATVEGLTVTTDSPTAFRSSIDRRSYGVATDLQSTTGSISDALRNIPSVEVDVQGNVSLRGDTNVTIMIDGKPSGQFRGEGKAQALQNLPADQIERVEVITNPSAAFKPDGAAGIINLISKKTRKPGGSGSVRANVGSSGRRNGGLSGSYNSNKVTLSGDAALRHDRQAQDFTDTRSRLNPATGAFVDSYRVSSRKDVVDFGNVRGSLDYDPDAKTRISGELRHNQFKFDTQQSDAYGEPTPAAPVTAAYDRDGRLTFKRANTEGSAGYRRKFTGFEHELVLDLSQERTSEDSRRHFVTANRVPAAGTLLEDIGARTIQDQTQFKAAYTRPMPGESKLKTGYELEIDHNDYDNFGSRGTTLALVAPDPTLLNHFLYTQTIHSLYGTYEKPFGDFTVLGGLRLEEVQIDTRQATLGLNASNDYFRAYPTLHLAYKLSDAQQLTASYSHRVQRPQPQDLNPFRIYADPFNYRQGNPNLKPQETHSLEAGYQYRANGTFYLATAYYRQSYKGVTDVIRDLGGGVFLTTRENLGESRSGGLELVANGKVNKKISYNVSGNAYWNEIDASSLGFAGRRSAWSLGGRANLNWQVTDKDFLQVNGSMMGKRLTAQGYRKPSGIVNLGYRHKFNDQLSAVVTVQDALKTLGDTLIINTPVLRERAVATPDFRAVFVGLTYSFGSNGRKARDPGFEFGGGGGPP